MAALSNQKIPTIQNSNIVGLGPTGDNLSIMIPNYNGAKYIAQTLESLKAIDSSISHAEIVVVDNASTDESETIVRRIWGDRVRFHQNGTNLGMVANWNVCLKEAQRGWIHIIHSDDTVLPEAYEEFDRCIVSNDNVTAVFARCAIVDEELNWFNQSLLLGPKQRGIFQYDPGMWAVSNVYTASVLISRAAYQNVGMFDLDCSFAADVNYFWRVARSEVVAYSNVCTGQYRTSAHNYTSKAYETGENISKWVEHINMVVASLDECPHYQSLPLYAFYGPAYEQAVRQCERFLREGNRQAFSRNYEALKMIPKTAIGRRKNISFGLKCLQLLPQIVRQSRKR